MSSYAQSGLASVTAEKNVVESTGEMNARFARHVDNRAESVNLSSSKPDPTVSILVVDSLCMDM